MEYLQKKMWIEVNSRLNKFTIGKGDLQKIDPKQLWSKELTKVIERDWEHDVDTFPND
jgi:hypothetical protein